MRKMREKTTTFVHKFFAKMRRIQYLSVLAVSISALLALGSCTQNRYATFSGYAQGGVYEVKADLQGIKVDKRAVAAHIEDLLTAIDTTLSGYNRLSLLSRLNRGESVTPNRYLEEVYDLSHEYFVTSGGAFDVAAGPLFDIWGFGFTNDSLPSDSVVAETLGGCGMKNYPASLSDVVGSDGRVSIKGLNFNAIAQGYSCDVIARYLHRLGVRNMMVNIGEIYCEGVNEKGSGWTLGIDNPVDGNQTPGKDIHGIWKSNGGAFGVVTSGNYRKFYIKDGRKYSHTIDPRTGYPVEGKLLSATIVAPSAAQADAYATACMVMGPEEAREFIESDQQIEGYLISEDGVWTSPGFTLMK